MKKTIKTISAFALITTLSLVAFAAVIVDDGGFGFVGKGDVQLAFGWSNAQLQTNANSVSFTLTTNSVAVTEVSWVCTNDRNENIQQRELTTTTTSSTSGIVESVARVKNQVTGFNLLGFDGDPDETSSEETEGNPLNSCPSGPWTLTTSAGNPVPVSESINKVLTISATGYDDKEVEVPNN